MHRIVSWQDPKARERYVSTLLSCKVLVFHLDDEDTGNDAEDEIELACDILRKADQVLSRTDCLSTFSLCGVYVDLLTR